MARASEDHTHLSHALELASRGRLWVTPNPMVGCVIVKNGHVIAQGIHGRFGGPHAEVVALKAAGKAARGSTLYVNLEPCSHQGKTPPCTESIVRSGVKAVVACTRDPNPLVSGRGFRALREAGIEVRTGMLRREAVLLNEKFFWHHAHEAVFFAVKLAQTLDGRIADHRGRSRWITSLEARARAHVLRSEYEAVVVGAGTVLSDDPALTVRLVKGRQPVRVILDGRFRVPPNARVFRSPGGRVLLLTSVPALRRNARRALVLERQGVEVFGIGNRTEIPLKSVGIFLRDQGIQSALVEGGSVTISAFVRQGLANRVYVFTAPRILGSGLSSVAFEKPVALEGSVRLRDLSVERCGRDILITGRLYEQ